MKIRQKLKKFLAFLIFASLILYIPGRPVSASSGITPKSVGQLVSLGDSITYGYNLDPNNSEPSASAFPSLLASWDHFAVKNLGVPGWTSSDLLSALQTKSYQNQIQNAAVITLDIGSNDLLCVVEQNGLAEYQYMPQQFANTVQTFSSNLIKILAILKQTAPSAKIIMYNLYDPFSSSSLLYPLSGDMVTSVNRIISLSAAKNGIPVADAYTAFKGKHSSYILQNDVHPSRQGQQELALLGENILQKTFQVGGSNKTFSDISTGYYAKDAIEALANQSILFGYSDGTFKPNQPITRAEFVAMLVRVLGKSTAVHNTTSPFKDVIQSEWFAGSIDIASKAGLVNGYSDGTFRPNQEISREELLTMLVHAWKASGIFDATLSQKDIRDILAEFTDADQVQDWARDSMAIAIKEGITSGIGNNELAPNGIVDRGQSASFLYRLMKKLKMIH